METKYFKNDEFDYEACKQDAKNDVPEAQILLSNYLQFGEKKCTELARTTSNHVRRLFLSV